MSLFSQANLTHYAIAIGLIVIATFVGNRFKSNFDTTDKDEYELIRKYLLNDNPLYGYDRPKLWIHSKYEYNARMWKSFGSRSSVDLNQPYIHLTVKTIINHCGNDFNVCLIDDDSFSRLIPGWDVKISGLAEPLKSHQREIAFAELLYIYGGLVVPNSFICLKNLMPFYLDGIRNDKPFVCEMVNRFSNKLHDTKQQMFTANPGFMGTPKRSPEIKSMIKYLKERNVNPHFSNEPEFLGYTSFWCNYEVAAGKINMVDGLTIGVKTNQGKPVLLEDLMEENELAICPKRNYGILIPADELLKRFKYQWFAVMNSEELLKTNMIVTRYLQTALTNVVVLDIDAIDIQGSGSSGRGNRSGEGRTVISI